jgi:hypothetical protein
MHTTAGARDNMNSIRTHTRVHRFDLTRARMCDTWLAACVLRCHGGGDSFQAHVRAHRSVRSLGCAIAAGTRYTQPGHIGT